MSQTISQIMERIMNLQEFTVTRTLPEDFAFTGQVPFDMTVKDNIAKIKVYALDITEAEIKVDNFLKN